MFATPPCRVPADAPPRALHRVARQLGLVAVSVIALSLWSARSLRVGPMFVFMGWNLFLAWVPWLLSLALPRVRRPGWFWSLLAVWLGFFPNAPYLLTDLIHLRHRAPVPLWFDVLFFASFAWAGCLLGWDSLSRVHAVLTQRLGEARAAALVCCCVALCGFGVFLGRFERLNSWELLTAPGRVLRSAGEALLEPRALVFSLVFSLFVGAGYLFTVAPTRR